MFERNQSIKNKMKGIVSVGCSIAKGYGFWLYNNNYNKDTSNISNIQLNKHLRYTDIVSNYFNTFYIMNDFLSDTGDERQSLEFCEKIVGDGFPYKPTDFSVLLFQLSWPGRCYLEYGDEKIKLGPYYDDDGYQEELVHLKLEPTQYYQLLKEQILSEIEILFKKVESYGIQPILIRGSSEYDNDFTSYLESKLLHIKLGKDDNSNRSIDDLLTYGKDGKVMFITSPNGGDSHPSMEFHNIIAQNIIDTIITNRTPLER